jgi:hypothetical protein
LPATQLVLPGVQTHAAQAPVAALQLLAAPHVVVAP